MLLQAPGEQGFLALQRLQVWPTSGPPQGPVCTFFHLPRDGFPPRPRGGVCQGTRP